MHNRGTEPDGEWTSLVRVLHDDVDGLVAHFMYEVHQLPSYATGLVPPELLEADAGSSFDYLLRRIGGLPVLARLDEIGPSIGRDRARRGVPLNDLLTAVRLDFRVLWHALRESHGRGQATVLVDRAEHVWEVVEEYSTTIQVSYLEESALMSRERARERNGLVASLLSRPDPSPQDVTRVALALDVDPEAPFLVAASRSGNDKQLRTVADALAAGRRRAHLHESSTHTTLIVRWHSEHGATASSLFRDATCGIAPLTSRLAEVPRAARIAQEIVDVLPRGTAGPHEVRDAWVLLAGARLGELGQALARETLQGLDGAHTGERDRLLATALTFAQNGSVTQTGRLLYCHRNTVVNRLRRLKDLIGLDITKPNDAALLVLAASWRRTGES